MNEHEGSEEGGEGLSAAERVALIRGANDAWAAGATSVSALVGQLESIVERILADRLAAVQAERDDACKRLDEQIGYIDAAESARDTALREKADLEARLAAVEALADEWEATPTHIKCYALDRTHGIRLRAALANPSDQPEES